MLKWNIKSKIPILLYQTFNFQNISPGTVYTEMVLKGQAEMEGKPFDPTLLEGPLPDQCLDPNDVADSVLYILGTSPRVQVVKITIQIYLKCKLMYIFLGLILSMKFDLNRNA